ncbi:MAG: efflux RND transporter permease subunit, partial [Bacteroidia bacterium]
MWKYFSAVLLRNKLAFTIAILLVTVFMAMQAFHIEKSYEFPKILPDDDSTYMDYMDFKKQFGEDGNIMVVGFEDKDLFKVDKFNDLSALCKKIKTISGIKEVMSIATIYTAVRNDSLQKFDMVPVVPGPLKGQRQMDSIRDEILKLKFYEGLIFNKETGANLILITFNKKELDSQRRITIVRYVDSATATFAKKYNVQMHYSGMPYIRAVYMEKISHEMTLFIILAVIVLAIILWLFFRSVVNVVFSLLIVVVGVVWSFGILVLFGYKITILSSLIPALTMVIGLPNCIFLINKYQSEFVSHGNKIKALSHSIETIGVTLFLANITTAIGFGVLYFTKSSLLVEFGEVAAISVMTTYMITLILVPIILYLLPDPKAKHTKHLEGKRINKILAYIDYLVHNKRPAIYITITLVTLFCYWGMTKVSFLGYVVDDLPKND